MLHQEDAMPYWKFAESFKSNEVKIETNWRYAKSYFKCHLTLYSKFVEVRNKSWLMEHLSTAVIWQVIHNHQWIHPMEDMSIVLPNILPDISSVVAISALANHKLSKFNLIKVHKNMLCWYANEFIIEWDFKILHNT